MQQRGSINRVDPAAGFSLLEVMVVLLIMAIGTALALPAGNKPTAKAALRSAAAELAGDLRSARADAMRTNADRTLAFDLERRVYWSDLDPRPRAFARSVAFEIEDDTFEWSGQQRRIRFRPDGGATGGTIRLTSAGHAVRVSVDWLTGATALAADGDP